MKELDKYDDARPDVARGSSVNKWAFVTLLLGLGLSGHQLIGWLNSANSEYTPPQLEELRIDQGKISFMDRWKSSGGHIVLFLDNGKKLILSCSAPGSDVDSSCYQKRNSNNKWDDYRHQLTGRLVTAWWQPEADTSSRRIDGRIYQLQDEDVLYYKYAERIQYYTKSFHGNGNGRLFFSALYFFILVVPSLRVILKEKQQ